MHIRISLATKFLLKVTIWFFGPKLPQKCIYDKKKKTEKVSIIVKFSIFKLVKALNLTLKNYEF